MCIISHRMYCQHWPSWNVWNVCTTVRVDLFKLQVSFHSLVIIELSIDRIIARISIHCMVHCFTQVVNSQLTYQVSDAPARTISYLRHPEWTDYWKLVCCAAAYDAGSTTGAAIIANWLHFVINNLLLWLEHDTACRACLPNDWLACYYISRHWKHLLCRQYVLLAIPAVDELLRCSALALHSYSQVDCDLFKSPLCL